MCDVQEESTQINVRSYWPSVAASGAMLLATDALSVERTLGSYMLSECDLSKDQIAKFAYRQGSAELLLNFAKTYDAYAGQLLDQSIFNTWLQSNVTELKDMILDENSAEMCHNLTDVQRTNLTLRWAECMQLYILAVDEIRENVVIPGILQVFIATFITFLSPPVSRLSKINHKHVIFF